MVHQCVHKLINDREEPNITDAKGQTQNHCTPLPLLAQGVHLSLYPVARVIEHLHQSPAVEAAPVPEVGTLPVTLTLKMPLTLCR